MKKPKDPGSAKAEEAIYRLPTPEEVRNHFFRVTDHSPMIWVNDLARLMGSTPKYIGGIAHKNALILEFSKHLGEGVWVPSHSSLLISVEAWDSVHVDRLKPYVPTIREEYKSGATTFLSAEALYILLMHYRADFRLQVSPQMTEVALEAILANPKAAKSFHGVDEGKTVLDYVPRLHPRFLTMPIIDLDWRGYRKFATTSRVDDLEEPKTERPSEAVEIVSEEPEMSVDRCLAELEQYLVRMRGLAATCGIEWTPEIAKKCIGKWSKEVPRKASDLVLPLVGQDLPRKPKTGLPKKKSVQVPPSEEVEKKRKDRYITPGRFSELVGIFSYPSYKKVRGGKNRSPKGHAQYILALLKKLDLIGAPEYGHWTKRTDRPRWLINYWNTRAYIQKIYGDKPYMWPNTVNGTKFNIFFYRTPSKIWTPLMVSKNSKNVRAMSVEETVSLRRNSNSVFGPVDSWDSKDGSWYLVWEGDHSERKREEVVMAVYQYLAENESADVIEEFVELWGISGGQPAFVLKEDS